MTVSLEVIFRELGLTQYLDSFVDQGFDTWDTILDIQESDLDALGVKLGHRRKLQRRIANARGVAPSVSLASSAIAGSDDGKQDGLRRDACRIEAANEGNGSANGTGVTKRKYRRHPKPDENAPERPPSAYVLFSNKMREDVKDQNLTFTEIAKLVGENWQNLPPPERESYENQANVAKEKYHRDLAEYKKTMEYQRYAQYLQDFKERQAKHSQAQDTAKRVKVEPARLRHGSSSSSSATRSGTNSTVSGSSSERLQGSEPPPSRQRIDSASSMVESPLSSIGSAAVLPRNSNEDFASSPRMLHQHDVNRKDSTRRHSRRRSSWRESTRPGDADQPHLPSLLDMLDDGSKRMSASIGTLEGTPYIPGFVAANQHRSVPSTGSRSSLVHNKPSSNGSSVSGSSVGSGSRVPGDGPLPIHALLSNQTTPRAHSLDKQPPSFVAQSTSPVEPVNMPFGRVSHESRGYGFQSASSAFQNMKMEQSREGDVVMTPIDVVPIPHDNGGKSNYDGMSALLRAGEIVGRRN